MTGIIAATGIEPLTLLPVYFKPFLAPEPINPFEVDYPIPFSQLDGNPAVTVSRMFEMKLK